MLTSKHQYGNVAKFLILMRIMLNKFFNLCHYQIYIEYD